MLKIIENVNGEINGFVWGIVGLALLIGTGILMTVLTRGFQISHLAHWWKNTIGSLFKKEVISHTKEKGTISPFQALCTALAATVGTGNIAGVAAAICIGGAGAVFWMWVAAFFGMMTNFAENTLGIYFRRRNKEGEWSGGAMYYLRDGLGKKKGCKWIGIILAVFFCIFTLLASFGIGSMGQVNKIVANVTTAFDIPALSEKVIYETTNTKEVTYELDEKSDVEEILAKGEVVNQTDDEIVIKETQVTKVTVYHLVIGILIMVLVAIITIGGVKRIANVAEKIVPIMVVLYIVGSLIIIGINYQAILPAFKAIFKNAFAPEKFVTSAGGGLVGGIILAMTNGFKRGVFSNEAGLGSSVMVHSNSNVKEPVKQGMWGIFEVFADTMVVCTMTALVILTAGGLEGGVFNVVSGAVDPRYTDATLVGGAFNTILPWGGAGAKFVAVAMFLFAFTTVLGWSHYGSKAWEYVFGTKSVVVFKIIHVCTIIFGAIMTSTLAWDVSDTFNGMMMFPNLIAVIALSPLVVKITKNYVDRKIRKKNVKPILSYDPELQKDAERDLEK
ncbi:MAG: alanine:cation symporter family protein [Ruminococcaceae bacterium]|nr:alanine:cation symporter family protein [Oscillospiraceae bacterium]